MHTSALKGKR